MFFLLHFIHLFQMNLKKKHHFGGIISFNLHFKSVSKQIGFFLKISMTFIPSKNLFFCLCDDEHSITTFTKIGSLVSISDLFQNRLWDMFWLSVCRETRFMCSPYTLRRGFFLEELKNNWRIWVFFFNDCNIGSK